MTAAHSAVGAKRPITNEDLLAWNIANDPQMSPDGSRVVCTLTVVAEAAKGYQTHLWIVPTEASRPWQLTTARARETCPRWSPDGSRIAFVSDRGGAKQVYVISATGGEARPLTSAALSPSELAWSPGGQRLAFVGKPEPERPKDESDVRVISRLYYKQDGEGFWTAAGSRSTSSASTAGGCVRSPTASTTIFPRRGHPTGSGWPTLGTRRPMPISWRRAMCGSCPSTGPPCRAG